MSFSRNEYLKKDIQNENHLLKMLSFKRLKTNLNIKPCNFNLTLKINIFLSSVAKRKLKNFRAIYIFFNFHINF